MEMHQIRYFLAVTRQLNFTRAAEECNVAQPSLTRAIKKLEDELGGELFRRERQNTHITELGQMMLPLLQQTYDAAVAAKSLAGSYASGQAAPLTFAICKTVHISPFVDALTELARAISGLSIDFVRTSGSEVHDLLKAGEAELAVAGRFEAPWDRLNAYPLFDERYVLVAAAGDSLSSRDSATGADLAGKRLLTRPYCEDIALVERFLDALGLADRLEHRVAADEDVADLVAAGAGVAILPEHRPRPPNLAVIPLEGFDLSRTVYLYGVAGRQRSQASDGLYRLLRSAGPLWNAA